MNKQRHQKVIDRNLKQLTEKYPTAHKDTLLAVAMGYLSEKALTN